MAKRILCHVIGDKRSGLEDSYRKDFEERVLDPDSWRECARNLLESAACLEHKVDEFWQQIERPASSRLYQLGDQFVAVYFMLCAYAIENLLKARIVAVRRAEIVSSLGSGKRFPDVLRGHDLYELMKQAGRTALAVEEEILLRRLERSAVWYGRYPAPLNPSDLRSGRPSENIELNVGLRGYTSTDKKDIKRIVRELS